MIKFLTETFFFVLFFALFGVHARAANPGDILINEVAWMGSLPDAGETVQQAANDEWLELYNPTQDTISLNGWILEAKDAQPRIELKGVLPAGAYFLLSRANEKVAGMTADIVYPYKNNALVNTGEDLRLLDAQGNIIDEAGAATFWFAGDNSTKQTMERKLESLGSGSNQANWATSVNPGGTPGRQNTGSESPKPAPSPIQEQTPTPIPTQAPTPFPTPEPTSTQTPPPEPTSNPSIQPSLTPTPTPTETTPSNAEKKGTQESQILTPTPKPEKQNTEMLKKVVKKYNQASPNQNVPTSFSTTTLKENSSSQTASLEEASAKTTHIASVSVLASILALLSALFIFLLKKSLKG
ncbi:MAG: lamin tail domain-containing protein [Candidatus Spechtbacteria bacterium]|nr:lamin tail domain-containing protein [Candidatus Spechtbacteria bacterium]